VAVIFLVLFEAIQDRFLVVKEFTLMKLGLLAKLKTFKVYFFLAAAHCTGVVIANDWAKSH
jgi:hypothetical protein